VVVKVGHHLRVGVTTRKAKVRKQVLQNPRRRLQIRKRANQRMIRKRRKIVNLPKREVQIMKQVKNQKIIVINQQ